MFTPFKLFVVFITAISLNLGMVDYAEAKRMGSGGSFGSKFSHNKPVKKNNTAQREQATPSKAQATNQARKQQLASKGGLMGILGGLAIGGMLGALFFGGAFEGINFFDILIIALIGFLAYKLLFAKRKTQDGMTPATAGGGTYQQPDDNDQQQYRTSQNETSGSNHNPHTAEAYQEAPESNSGLDELRGTIPKDFDQQSFLQGAKSCFERLQKAWDEGDLAELRQFTTDQVFAEIQDQHKAKTSHSQTKVINLKAELLKVEELGSKNEATVLFEALINEDGAEGHISEIWHFTKSNSSLQPTWYVDGIQQVED